MGILTLTSGGKQVNLGARILVGRSSSCPLSLSDRLVSGEHAVIFWDQGQWWVRDLGSRNGTWVDGRRLPAGQAQPLPSAARLAFGQRLEEWALSDAGPPSVRAHHLLTGRIREGQNGLLLLPDEDSPDATLLCDALGRWSAELDQLSLPISDGQVLDIGGEAWRIELPLGQSSLSSPTEEGGAPLELIFRVSADEEHIELVVKQGGRQTPLEPRVYHYMLLLLARTRMDERGLDPAESGWVYTDALMDQLKIDRITMNLFVYRCRKQLAGTGMPSAAELLERRPHTHQIRIGTPLLQVSGL